MAAGDRAPHRPPDGSGVCGPPAPTGDVAAPNPAVRLRAELALQLHETPDLGAINPDVGLDMGSRPEDGGQIDAEQFSAPFQRGCDGPVERRVVGFPGLHDR